MGVKKKNHKKNLNESGVKKEFPLSQNIKEIPLFSFVRKDRQTDTDRQTNKQTDKHPQPCSENKTFGILRSASRQQAIPLVLNGKDNIIFNAFYPHHNTLILFYNHRYY